MRKSKQQNNFAACQRASSSSSTLLGRVSSEELESGTSKKKENDDHIYNSEDHGSGKTNVQQDDFVLPELLPSFEMYENLHINIPQSSFDTYFHENPPYYEVASGSQSALPHGESESNMRMINDDTAGPENLETTTGVRRLASDSSSPQIFNHDGLKGIPVEKIYALPRVETAISIELFVTKTAPKLGQAPKYGGMLKEYTSGDIIHGYFTVENRSTTPIKFDMFYLTLEGTTSSKTKSSFGTQKTTKTFLRMVDMAASWSYNQEDVNTGEDLCGFFDSIDKTSFGLSNERTLNPGDKRKKFFAFKIPNQLLEVSCKHRHFSHSLLPPTLGFDRSSSANVDANLKFSNSLGYGRLSERGSPLLLMDNSTTSNISYSINAMIVGKDIRSGSICLMSEKKYSIRMVPFGFGCEPVSKEKCFNSIEDFNVAIAKRLEKIEQILCKSERAVPIHEDDISDINNHAYPILPKRNYSWNKSPESVKNCAAEKRSYIENDYIESEMTYSILPFFNTSIKSAFLKSKVLNSVHNASSSQPDNFTSRMNFEKNGLIMMKVKPPTSSLPYRCPSLIQKQNAFAMKSKQSQSNWSNLKSLLPIEEREKLETLKIELVCVQAANSVPHDPPEISSIQTQLICLTEKTEDCKPLEFHTDLLVNKRKFDEVKKSFKEILANIEAYSENFTNNETRINSLLDETAKASLHGKPPMFSYLMPPSTIKDVQVLAHTEVDVTVVENALKSKLAVANDVHPCSPYSISSIIPRASRSIIKTASSNHSSSSFSHCKLNEWNRIGATEYTKTLSLNIKFNEDFKGTIVPSFQSCLCSRSYLLRVKLQFNKSVGTSQIDIPIQVKNSFI